MRVSACIITKNEIHNIESCIISARRLADEIIVADTGSDDGTPEKARVMGAKVYVYNWHEDFAAAKNFALSKANGDWIFFPDADEYIEQDTADLFLTAMKNHLKSKKVDALTGILYNIDKQSGQVEKAVEITRIFKNKKEIRYKGKIHEKLYQEVGYLNHIVLPTARIYHTGYTKSLLPQKHERNLRMLLEAESAGEATASDLYHIASILLNLGRHEEAAVYIERLEKHRDFTGLLEHFSLMPRFFVVKALVMLRLGDRYTYDDVITAVQKGIAVYPKNTDIAEQKINIGLSFQRYDETLCDYENILGLYDEEEKKTGFSHKRDRSRTLSGMAMIYLIKGDKEAAFDFYVKALAEDYTYSMALAGLLELLRPQPAKDIIDFLSRLYDEEVVEQVGFLTSLCAKAALPEVFFHYFGKLTRQETDRYEYYLIYQKIFCGVYADAGALVEQLLEGETKQERRKELCVLSQVVLALAENPGRIKLKEVDQRETYIAALELLLKLDKIPIAESFLDHIPEDDLDMLIKVAELMKSIELFTAAADFYQMVLAAEDKKPDQAESVKAMEGLAYCCYRAGDIEGARELYKKIEDNSKAAPQFLKWMGE